MTAEYEFEMTFEGSPKEIKRMLEVFGHYEGNDNLDYFTDIKVNGRNFDFKNITEEAVSEIAAADDKVSIDAWGP